MRIQWRTQNDDEEQDAEHGRQAAVTNEPSELDAFPDGALQAPAEDLDLNVLMERMGVTNQRIPTVPINPNLTMDVRDIPDLQGILDLSREAEKSFSNLPIALKERFNQNPAELWRYVNNPDNHEEAVRLGILQKAVERSANTATKPDSGSTTTET